MAITPTDIATVAVVINRCPGLSPSARRLGLELLNRVDRRTGAAWPSEARLAEALSLNIRTIRRAKLELRHRGFLTWCQRGRSRTGRTPLYAFAWAMLRQLAADLRNKITATCDAAKAAVKSAKQQAGKILGRTSTPSYPFHKNNPSLPPLQNWQEAARERLWKCITGLGSAVSEKIIDALTPELEAKAAKAERYKPNNGRSGLAVIVKHLETTGALA